MIHSARTQRGAAKRNRKRTKLLGQLLEKRLMLAADLNVTSFNAPAAATSQSTIPVDWTVENSGDQTASTDWVDRIYLSEDETIDDSDQLLLTRSAKYQSPIDASEIYSASRHARLPAVAAGDYFLIAITDADDVQSENDETNNVVSRPIMVSSPDIDLTVSAVDFLSTVTTEDFLPIRWTTTNDGNELAGQTWTDRIYLSSDDVLDGEDRSIGTVNSSQRLAGSQSYEQSANIRVSATDSGAQFILVQADANNQQAEDDESNNVFAFAVDVQAADLSPTNLVVTDADSTTLVSGNIVDMSWTVSNLGAHPALGSTVQRIVYSSDNVPDDSDLILSNLNLNVTDGLSPSASVNQSTSVTLRNVPAGDGFILVTLDPEANRADTDRGNQTVAIPVSVSGVDVELTSIEIDADGTPSEVVGNSQTNVSWTVTNLGSHSIDTGWNDVVYFSVDSTLNPETDEPLQFRQSPTGQRLGASESYTQSVDIDFGGLPSGSGFLFVSSGSSDQSDDTNAVNDSRSIPITVVTADLRADSLDAPASAISGSSIDVEWMVTNVSDTQAAPRFWSDHLYLSADDQFDSGDQLVGQGSRNSSSPLGIGSNYQVSRDLTLPMVAPGTYHLIVVADADQNLGDADQSNNVTTSTIEILGSDLAVDSWTSVPQSLSGDFVSVSWSVRNDSPIPIEGFSSDRIYASADNIFDDDDLLIGSDLISLNQPLAPGATYERTTNVSLKDVSPGHRFLILVADSDNQYSDSDRSNNASAAPVTISMTNLTANEVVVPSSVATDQTLTTSWTIENTGATAAVGSWNDRIYLSTDPFLDESDRQVASRSGAGFAPLDSGSTYTQSVDFSIRRTAPGDYFILVASNADASIGETDDGDNVAVAPITITNPDVEATSLGGPDAAILGETVTLTWTVTNVSDAIAAANWTDRVYLSNDETVNAFEDVSLTSGFVNAQTPLQPGESYSFSRDVVLRPFDTGDQFLLLQVDVGNSQFETSLANNTLARPINLSAPDLTVTELTAPLVGVVGGTIDLSYTVENSGGVAAPSTWRDYAFLSDDMIRDANDRQIGNFTRPNALDAGQSYTNSQTASLFNAVPGDQFLILEADGNRIQGETDESNNTRVIPITISVPDLIVSDSNAPTSANFNEPFDISWTVTNDGTVEAPTNWNDAVYISANDQLDQSDRRLRSVASGADSPLAAGASYSRNITTEISGFNIPSGDVFLLIATDDDRRQAETNDRNNVTAIPISVAAPDLIVTNVSGPAEAKPGDEIEVSWTVQNVGDGPALAQWRDFVAISDDQQLDCPFECGEFDLGVVDAASFSPLAPGESYTQTMMFTVPQQASFGSTLVAGEYFLGVSTDDNFGSDQSESDETNNQRVIPITILPPDVDLQVTAFSAPNDAIVGESISVDVTVTNNGTEPATGQSGFWRDLIQLTDDANGQTNLNTILRRNANAELPLAAGASYTFTIDVEIPASATAGDQFLVANADGFDNQVETDETNNISIRPINLSAPNLIVTDFNTPATTVAGVGFNVSWTVKNESAIEALGDWSDSIYLSDNNVFDSGDRFLASQNVSGQTPLPADGSYSANRFVTLNNVNPGNRFLILRTDVGNDQGETNEDDNFLVVPITIATTDLAISNVEGPTGAATGQTIDVNRTVTNTTNAAVDTNWTDAVFLSDDAILDPQDIRIGTQSSAEFLPLAGQGSYTAPISATIPSVEPGDYFLIVEVNAFDNVFEFSRNNNTEAVPVSIAAPDVAPTELTIPGQAISNDTISISFTVENNSAISAEANWRDAVFFSDDALLDAGDTKLTTSLAGSTLTGGQTYATSVDVTLPGAAAGDYFLIVQVDEQNDQTETDETNNTISQPITLDAPNLLLVSASAPTTATIQEPIDVSFRVENAGTFPSLGVWNDYVWLSDDDTVSNDDRLLRIVSQSARSPLAPASVYESNVQVILPPDRVGDQFLLFQANGSSSQGETSQDDNVVASSLTIAGPPNLAISDVSLPSVAAAGESIDVSYTVTNIGDTTAYAHWTDLFEVFETETATNRLALAHTLPRSLQAPALMPGESYQVTETVIVPRVDGELLFAVTANGQNTQSETTRSDNQIRVPISVRTPDLLINSVSTVAVGTLGESITINYTTRNPSDVVAAFSWVDQIYLSTDNIFDANDLPIVPGGILSQTALPGGETSARSISVSLPGFPTGNRFLFVELDTLSFQPETDESNNVSDAIPIELIASDLTISDVSVAPQAIAGQAFVATWTITNNGSAPISDWIDEVFLSTDDAIGGDTSIGSFPFAGTIMPGESITRTQGVTPPIATSGDRFVVVRTDGPNLKPESNELNNAAVSQDDVTIQSAPTPNLRVREVTVPVTEVDLFQTIQVDFVVENVGDGSTNTPYWQDAIYLSVDELFDPTDVFVGRQFNPSFLAPGDAYSSSVIGRVSGVSDGLYYVLAIADGTGNRVSEINGEGDNVRVGPQIRVNLPPPPDLVVEEIVVPATAFSGQLAELSWTTTNQGDATAFPEWNETIYLSNDDFLDGNDTRLATVRYTAIHDIVQTVSYAGDYESCFGAPTPEPSESTLFSTSNLSSASRIFADFASNLQSSSIVCISGQNVVTELTNVELRTTNSRLDAGESVARSATVRLPEGVEGEMKFIVVTDSSDRVNEFAFDENNTTIASNSTTVLLTPPPDLVVNDVTTPGMTIAGTDIDISYEVSNDGATATTASRWVDSIYLSSDNLFDASVDIKLRDVRVSRGSSPLEINDTYLRNVSIEIPDGIDGDFFIFVVANDSTDQFEADRTNNTSAPTGPVSVSLAPPDLVVGSANTDDDVRAGETLTVQWTVTNQGSGATRRASWNDAVYRRLQDGNLQLLRQVPHIATLAAGESYQASTSIQIPSDASGDWEILIRADDDGRILETGGEDNNDSLPLTTNVILEAADLVATDGTLAITDGRLDLGWTVTNQGAGGTDSRTWNDGIYFSSNDTFGDGDDQLIHVAYHSGRLRPLDAYVATETIEVPFGLEGNFHVFAKADESQAVTESGDASNNATLLGQFSIDQLRIRPDLVVTDIIAPTEVVAGDLIEVSWTVQNVGDAIGTGPDRRFEYDRGFWRDAVYLSRDQVFDAQSDFYLGRMLGQRSELADIDVGGTTVQQYTSNGVFRVPRGLTGPLYVMVITDRNDNVVEQTVDGQGERNNLTVSNDVLIASLREPADLVVGNVTVPESAAAGGRVEVGYNIANAGVAPVNGFWTDRFYLSTDTVFSLDDIDIGAFFHQSADRIAPGESLDFNVSRALPSILPGDYHVILRTDVFDVIRESDESNNLSVSLETFNVSIPELQLTGPESTANLTTELAIGQSESFYFQFTASEGQSIAIDLTGNSIDAGEIRDSVWQVSVAHERAPSSTDFDHFESSALVATLNNFDENRLVIPRTKDGNYYVRVDARDRRFFRQDQLQRSVENATIALTVLPFSIFSASPGIIGNTGQATIEIEASSTNVCSSAELHFAGERIATATRVRSLSPTTAHITFDTQGLPAGGYTVRLFDHDGRVADHPLTIVDGVGPRVGGSIDGPNRVRRGQSLFYTNYGNNGDADAVAPLMLIRNRDSNAIALTQGGLNSFGANRIRDPGRVLQIMGISLEGDAGMLRPGQLGSIPVFFDVLAEPGDYELEVITADDPRLFPFDGLESFFRPDDISDVEWIEPRLRLQQMIGDTWGSYVRALADVATRLGNGGQRSSDVRILIDDLVDLAIDPNLVRLSGNLVTGAVCSVVAGASITAIDQQGNRSIVGSGDDGFFAFANIGNGPFDLTIEAEGFAREVIRNVIPADPAAELLVELSDESVVTGSLAFPQGQANQGLVTIGAVLIGSDDVNDSYSVSTRDSVFSLGGLRAGDYRVTVAQGNRLSQSFDVSLDAGQTIDLGSVLLDEAARIEGSVTSTIANFDVADAAVAAFQNDVQVAAGFILADGSYAIDDLSSGTYTIEVINLIDAFSTSIDVTVAAGQTSDNHRLQVLPGSTITGTVSDESNTAVANVAVLLTGANDVDVVTYAGPDGVFRFDRLDAGDYLLSLPGSPASIVSVPDTNGSVITNDLTRQGTTRITGRVTDVNGQPLTGAVIQLTQNDQFVIATRSDNDGRYTFLLNGGGTFDVLPSFEGASFQIAENVTVADNATADHDFTAGDGAIRITVDGATADATSEFASVQRIVGDLRLPAGSAFVGASGVVVFDDLIDGEYLVKIIHRDGRGAQLNVTVAGGQMTQQTAPLVERFEFTSVITDAGGNPIKDALVQLYRGSQLEYIGVTDVSGQFSIQGIFDDTYSVVVVADGFATSVTEDFVMDTDRTFSSTLAASVGATTGRIIDEAGLTIGRGLAEIIDATGRVVDTARIGMDGAFSFGGTNAAGLQLRVISEGYAGQLLSDIDTNDASLGDITLQSVGGVQGRGALAIPDQPPTAEGSQAEGLGGFIFGIDAGLLSYAFGDGDFARADDEPSVFDLVDADCPGCYGEELSAIQALNLLRVIRDASEDIDGDINYQRLIVKGIITLEITVTVGAVAAFIVALEGLAAAAAGSAGVATVSAGGAVGTSAAAPSALTIAYEATQIVQSVLAFGNIIQAVANAPDSTEAAASATTATDFFGNLSQSLNSLASIVLEVTSSGASGQIGATNGVSFVSAIATFINAVQFTESRNSLSILAELEARLVDFKQMYQERIDIAREKINLYNECANDPEECDPDDSGGGGGGNGDGPSPGDEDPDNNGPDDDDPDNDPDDTYQPQLIVSADPNDIIGPEGFGEPNWIGVENDLIYTIRFENLAEATAAAQRVTITQQLDADLDPRTFRVDDFGYSNQITELPGDQPFFQGREPLDDGTGTVVDIFVNVDTITGMLTWVLQTIDPLTGLPPADAAAGFLPPNDDQRRGEGFVSYRVRPRRDIASGDRIDAEATIIFDDNEPIDTPPIFNTIDAFGPTASVESLDNVTRTTDFEVSWTGSDDASGSGIRDYTVFVSVDGGPSAPWQSNVEFNSATFVGTPGREYQFSVEAYDLAGNVSEITPSTVATTRIASDAIRFPLQSANTAVRRGDDLVVAYHVDTDESTTFPLEVEFYAATADGTLIRRIGTDQFTESESEELGKTVTLPGAAAGSPSFVVVRVVGNDGQLEGVSTPSQTQTDQDFLNAGGSPWQNRPNRLDVSNDGKVGVIDALRVINELSRRAGNNNSELGDRDPSLTDNYYDVTGDERITPLDALRIINVLALSRTSFGEGEQSQSGIAASIDKVFGDDDWRDDDTAIESRLF